MVKFLIKKEYFEIKLKNKITKLSREEMVDLYCLVKALFRLEKNKGNELDKATIELKVKEDLMVTTHINIFKMVRIGTYVEFVEYFLFMKDMYKRPANPTKTELDSYLEERGDISQKIIIKMLFTIKTSEEEIEVRKNMLKKVDNDVFLEIYLELKGKIKM